MKASKRWMSYFVLLVLFYVPKGWSAEWTSNEQLSFPPSSFADALMPPEIGVDKKGNAFAVWSSQESMGNAVKASRYDSESRQWSFPKRIGADQSSSPRLAVTPDGKAIVVWKKMLEGSELLFFNVYVNEWGTEQAVDLSDKSPQDHPSVGVDELGHAIVVWQVTIGQPSEGTLASVIRSATYQFSTSLFTPAVDISTNYSLADHCYVGQPTIAVNASGKAIAIWRYDDSASTAMPYRIQSNTYQSGMWGKEEDVSISPTAQLVVPLVTISSKGDALAVWLQTGLNYYIVTAAKKTNDWSPVTALSDLGYVKSPLQAAQCPLMVHAAFDSKGNCYVAWNYIDESSENARYRIQAKTCQGDEWSKATTLIDSGAIPGSIKIAVDDLGNAWAVFATEEFSEEAQRADRIHVSRFIQGMNIWCVPELLSNESHNYSPNISANLSGNFHAVWVSDIHDFGIIQSAIWRADPPPPPSVVPPPSPAHLPMPPRNVRGWQLKNDFAIHSDRINLLTWEAPNSGTIPVAYRIYRDAELQELVVEVTAQARLRCEDPLRKRGKEYTYFLVSVDVEGRKSQPFKIVVKPIKR